MVYIYKFAYRQDDKALAFKAPKLWCDAIRDG